MKARILIILFLFLKLLPAYTADLLIEAESFTHKGGWVIDQQFMDLMGSPYLLAHGLGIPVENARTNISFPVKGLYYVYVRTYNWTSPWHNGEGAGKFRLEVGDKKLSVCGHYGKEWIWQPAGKVKIEAIETTLTLCDLTGFDGRCDAIYFTTDKDQLPPSNIEELALFRKKKLNHLEELISDSYDFVVVGGGIAGICAAVTAARLGLKVALINDRPVLGGNNSSEIRVHLGGRIGVGPYENLGNLIKEFGPEQGGNAQPAHYYEDDKKAQIVANEKNIDLFSNFHVFAVTMDQQFIKTVIAKHIETGVERGFSAPLFSDCTGDGTLGYLAGADYVMGREGRDEYNEERAPIKSDRMTMGSSIQWYSKETKKTSGFPKFNYGISFSEASCEKVTMGEWTWETGMNKDQINDFERIRDYGLMVVYSNWSFLKNEMKEKDLYKYRKLDWVAYIGGKRESRRLLGDYILKESDLRKHNLQEDGTASTTWSIDLHYPDPQNTKYFPNAEFKSIAEHTNIYPYPIPYRCFYSRNIDNLFMAGRNISVTHVALGTVRVMRTTGMMGEVVGMAASLCKKYDVMPRMIYRFYFKDLKELMKEGIGKKNLTNNQEYNQGGSLSSKPD
ncbi:FAD-dependent oxidoreductase [Tannerella forsythia]|uniref:FAD-dependent oxidoreductase n=1 Tax=Tannerella forsythia TaxID=28112 RepID=A0A3P1XIM8_TANFO|nr:FAD-dependent oxidoreductase [Tannerella forsythia]RRD58619.1 FAD-dependent oxidoreductase [Tannerella forsythia]